MPSTTPRQTMPQASSLTSTLRSARAQTTTVPIGTLRLRGAPLPPRRGIRWAEDVIDNEGLGRKSSKVCCIYHKPRAFDESSSESDSSSSDSDSSDSDSNSARKRSSGARIVGRAKGKGDRGAHDHAHDHAGEGGACGAKGSGKGKGRRGGRGAKNAYEKMATRGKGAGTMVVVVDK